MADTLKPGPNTDVPVQRVKDPQVAVETVVLNKAPTPPCFTRKLRKAAVGTGCDIRLRVSVVGNPKPSLAWFRNDEALEAAEAEDPGGLWIRECQTRDAGLYTCVATNELGEASSSAVLAIMDLGEDSENTEDEATEPQVPMETKEGPKRHSDKAARRGPSGEGGRMMEINPDGSDRRATLPGGYDSVVERELRALGSRPPGSHLDPTNSARIQTTNESKGHSSHTSQSSAPPQTPPASSVSDQLSYSAHIRGRNTPAQAPSQECSRANTHTDQASSSGAMTPKLARAGPKILDKVRAFEERMGSADSAKGGGSTAERSRGIVGRAASCDSYTRLDRMTGPTREDGTVLQDAAQRRSSFKQRASSLEDKTSYADRLQGFQSKFTEELQRIKNLVNKHNLKKAYSSEQLSQKDRPSLGRLEPIPPQVVKKLEAREKASGEGKPMLQTSLYTQNANLGKHKANVQEEGVTIPHSQEKPKTSASGADEIFVSMETAPVHKLPGQPLPTATQRSPIRETLKSSPASQLPLDSDKKTLGSTPREPLLSQSIPSAGKRASPVGVREEASAFPRKPPRLTLSPIPSVSPLVKRRRAEAGRSSPASKSPTIPTILVEEPLEAGGWRDEGNNNRTEGRSQKAKKIQPTSPEEGSSDDSYMSADEGPVEAPRFGRPLVDTTAHTGCEVTLSCTVTGNPAPTVTWWRGSEQLAGDARHALLARGRRHSLVIKRAGPSDGGTYRATAANAAGTASCSGTLDVQSEPTHMHCGKTALSLDVGSPIQSDEEYLSPQEEMEIGDPPILRKHVPFREPPFFQVALYDQGVFEGQEVVITVKVRGQPKPMVNWWKDKVAIKSSERLSMREATDGTSEIRISSAQQSDAGAYVCRAINEYGTKQSECRLEVKVAPVQATMTITRQLADIAVKAGESAMFECQMTGPPDVDVDWLSNGKLIQPALFNCKMHFDGKRCCLLLNSVHEDDSGTYICKLSTAKEELTSSASLKVIPSKAPLFTRKLDILEVIEGRTARFDCKVSGSPAPSISWRHFEMPVKESDDVRFLKENGRHSLVIAHVSSDTEGFYTAIAQNIHGKCESTAELYVQEHRTAISSQMAKLEKMPSIPEEPEVLESELERGTMPDFIKPLADVEVIEGREAVLKCKVEGLPYPAIAWYHNGKRIDGSEDRKMIQYRDVHSLVIRSACHAHGGVYKSVISNKVGKATCYAHLYITDIVPEPPDGPPVVEAITGKTICLRWKRPKRLDPSLDASSLMYVVQQQPLGSIQWSVITSNLKETSYTVTSLSKGVRYAFRVLTSTGKTFSKPTPSTDLVQLIDRGPYLRKAPIIMDKPDIVYVVENQPMSITITLNHVHALVTWKRRGVALVTRAGQCEMSMPDDDQHCLTLHRIRPTDVGQLVVTANNQFGSDLCTLVLALAVPPKFESIMEDVDVDVGQTSRLAVVVEGKPDPDILWYKDDILLSESSRFTFVYDEPEYSLVILNAHPEHSGVYTCIARNLAGAVSCKAELTVHTERKEMEQPVEDERTILRKMRRMTDYYDVHREIGRGAFSYVKRVTQKEGKAEFAAKFISARGKKKALALREMSLLSELDHQKILSFHDAFEKKHVLIVITELCHEELLERMAKKTMLQELEVRSSVRQILEGLSYLQKKEIAHMDIKPENILMVRPGSDQIRICDFGNAMKLEAGEQYYCKYGTPEYVAPEIVNQTPVSMATDIWPVGVITYLCLTGVSPFAGENDKATVLNIRNYNVAFEESMFSDFCKEAKGFVIKLLVVDILRPTAVECLRHPWFKSSTNRTINTAMLKQVLSRRRWQRSLINYKSKMVMRTIPELLNDSASHISIAVARHLKEGSPPPSSSSDSDEDVDELPFIPMPLSMVFSGSRVSLNEIPGDEDGTMSSNGTIDGTRQKGGEMVTGRERTNHSVTEEKDVENDGVQDVNSKQVCLIKGSSVESENLQTKSRRATMRRGSSADSALLLHIDAEESDANRDSEANKNKLKKAVSMELPNRSSSPGVTKLSQEDYAFKLELMRQRLLRGGSVDKKMSGLRGPLFETLGMDDERQTGSLDRNLRRSHVGPPTLTRAASSESPGEDMPKTKVFRKSSSFTQGDSEPMLLHRRFGAPLEIPSLGHDSTDGKKLQEATSMSVLSEQTNFESTPASPTKSSSFMLPTAERMDQQKKHIRFEELENEIQSVDKNSKIDEMSENWTKNYIEKANKPELVSKHSQDRPPSVLAPIIVIEEDDDDEDKATNNLQLNILRDITTKVNSPAATPKNNKPSSAYASVMQTIVVPSGESDVDRSQTTSMLSEHPAVFSKVAAPDRPSSAASTKSIPECPTTPRQPVLRTDIKDIDSEEVFEARFKKRESSLTRGLRRLTGNKSEEKSPVLSRRVGPGGEEVYRPGLSGAPLEMASQGLKEKSKSVQDLREVEKETGLSLIGRFSLRSKRSSSVDKKTENVKKKIGEEKPQEVLEGSASKRRVSWAIGRSKSLDTKEPDRAGQKKILNEKEQSKVEESSVFTMRRKFESKVAGISAKIRTSSEERKEKEVRMQAEESTGKDPGQKDIKKISDSPVLAMRQRFENKVAAISTKIRSQSEERGVETEGKKTPLFMRHRHSHSEGRGLKGMGIPENQLAKQAASGTSKESIESNSSIHSEKVSHTPESDRRSRWDRWGLSRSKKDKTPSQPDLPRSITKDEASSNLNKSTHSASDFPPVFHIKLKDHVLLEGDPVTLSCLPAGSPHPQISWMKDKKPLEVDDRIRLISHPDGRQLLMIMKTSHKDAGLYECVATNPLATITSSCLLSLACVPKQPGTPEVPQTYKNTALVLWKPADTKAPCNYTLERRTEGEDNWLIIATGVVDCYNNVTDLPPGGTFRFRVACVNKAGQGPYSNHSDKITLDPSVRGASPSVAVVKTVPAPPTSLPTSTLTAPSLRPVQTSPPSKPISLVSSPSPREAVASPPPQPSSPAGPSPPSAPPKPPFVLPKPQSPINVVPPMAQAPSPLIMPPPTPTKPSSLPSLAPTPVSGLSFSPQVLQVSSLSPIGEGASPTTRGTPSGRATPSTSLRQGVPQKPYTFLDEKARGRFGVVRECRENSTGKIYMAKIVPYDQDNKPAVLREYELLKSLHSDKVMSLHEAYVTPRYLVLVLEYCTGKELLYTLIDRFRYSEDDVVSYLVQILQGVEYLHNRRILHLDLKPDNIMVTHLNAVKIVDFGSAQAFNPLSLKLQDSDTGTLEYMAPEMVKGDVVGPPADIWTLGVLTYIMLSGRLPFQEQDPIQTASRIQAAKFDSTKLYPNVSQSASAFLKKMLSSYPWARPTTKDCFTHAWLQDTYLMKLRRQTLTFTTCRLKELLVEQQGRRTEAATKHKVLLRQYQSSARSAALGNTQEVPAPK